ncbi:expressed unknown protein [Seminavis robusta]|uniref:Uncharacterized protein n=1 Tax=Seminavis robusta TaxID=568900 RepID=A0A9N8DC86_9STRA|nr:expressed unknown protein [Seminavis robusta]|eukprot:Sro56_g032930.1 n/a (278) ;mRNA; f:109653-110486
MDIAGEEKKDSCEVEEIGKDLVAGDGDGENNDSEEDEEVADLPSELATKLGDRYESEEALQSDMNEAGIGDLPIILAEGKPCLVVPSDQHNVFTSWYAFDFASSRGKWGFSSASHNIHLANGESRDPDLSYWGYPRCILFKEKRKPVIADIVPDTVIQFSWKNKKKYEVEAINDVMTQSLETDCGAPSTIFARVGYLIKVQFSKKRTLLGAIMGKDSKTQDIVGLDIYRLPHGTTTMDAENKTNGAEKWTYFHVWSENSRLNFITQFLKIKLFRQLG